MRGGHTRLKGSLKKYHKKLLMKHSPGPTPLWFTTTNGKGPSKWKMETDKHSSFEVLYPKGTLLWLKSGVQLLRKAGYILASDGSC